jgi:hypothetical protein
LIHGLGELVGLAHLGGVEPEGLGYLNPRSAQQFEADAGDDLPDGRNLAAPVWAEVVAAPGDGAGAMIRSGEGC